jgi:hypothetical protein
LPGQAAIATQGFLTLADELRPIHAQTGEFLEAGVAHVRFAVSKQRPSCSPSPVSA